MQALSLWGNWPLGTCSECRDRGDGLLSPSLLGSHVEDLCVYFRQAQLLMRQLRDWGRLRSLTLKSGAPYDFPDLCSLLQDLAGATQLHSMTWVLPSYMKADSHELSQAMARLRVDRPELHLRLLLE